jgi:hypothetical protein
MVAVTTYMAKATARSGVATPLPIPNAIATNRCKDQKTRQYTHTTTNRPLFTPNYPSLLTDPTPLRRSALTAIVALWTDCKNFNFELQLWIRLKHWSRRSWGFLKLTPARFIHIRLSTWFVDKLCTPGMFSLRTLWALVVTMCVLFGLEVWFCVYRGLYRATVVKL